MKNLFSIIAVSLIVGSISGAISATLVLRTQRKNLSTTHLEIVDASGKRRATLGVDANQVTTLQFFGPNQARQLSLGVVDESRYKEDLEGNLQRWSPEIELDDETGRRSAILGATSHGNTRLDFFGIQGLWHMGLGFISDGSDVMPIPGVWGVRMRAQDLEAAYGVYAQPTADGEEFMPPVLDSLGNGAHYKSPNQIMSPVLRPIPLPKIQIDKANASVTPTRRK